MKLMPTNLSNDSHHWEYLHGTYRIESWYGIYYYGIW